jgi:hypothetical protein
MIQWKGVHVEFLFVEHTSTVSARKFPDRQPERKLKIGCTEGRIQKNSESFRAEDIERSFTSIEMKRTEQAGDAVQVIAVKVPNENRMNAAPPDTCTHELDLGSLAAIEKKDVAFADQRSR